jgi:hypothetical protein
MTWAKIDDQFHGHRKAKRAWKGHARALGLHLLAISYCAGHLTDGLVDDEFVEEKLPGGRERGQVTQALVDAGLWRRVGDGWEINDWLEYNPSREEVVDRRRRDSERKARGRQAQSERSPRGLQAESDGPDPTRPDQSPPSPPRGNRIRDRKEWEEQIRDWALRFAVAADERALMTAVKGCQPWRSDDPVGTFRRHCATYFVDSITWKDAA